MSKRLLFRRSESRAHERLWHGLRSLNWCLFLLLIACLSALSGGYISRPWLMFSAVFYLWFSLAIVLFAFGAHINWRAIKSAKWPIMLLLVSLLWLSLPLFIPFEHGLYDIFDVTAANGPNTPDWFSPALTWSVSPDRTRWLLLSEFLMLCLFVSTLAMVDTRQRLKQLLVLLMLIGVVHASLGLMAKLANVLLVDHRQVDGHFDVARGLFVNRNHFSAFLVLTLAGGLSFAWHLLFNERVPQRWGYSEQRRTVIKGVALSLVIALTLVACLRSESRGGMLALVIGILLMLVASKPVNFRLHKTALLCVFVPTLVGLLYFGQDLLARLSNESFSLGERWVQWEITLAAIADNPLMGYGGGGYGTVFQVYREQTGLRQVVYAQSHNHFLHVWLERGFVGLGLWLAFLVLIFKRVFSAMKKVRSHLVLSAISAVSIVLIAALVQSLVDFNLQILNIRAFFFMLLALLFASPYIRHVG